MPQRLGYRKLPPDLIDQVIRDYLTPLPDGTWMGTHLLESKWGISDSAILNYLRQRSVPIRNSKESHAYGKRCKPVKNLPPKDEPIPICKCGCLQPVEWNQRKNRWNQFIDGHYRPKKDYHNHDWLYDHYITQKQNLSQIGSIFGVGQSTILKSLHKLDIPQRSMSEAHRGLQMGSDNPAWKGGTTPERQRLYKQGHWREFSLSIYARDNYLCQRCGNGHTAPRTLHCHHLQAWASNPSLRFDPANCITLCQVCHSWVHSKANVNREFLK